MPHLKSLYIGDNQALGGQLCSEFLRVWTKNHDLNANNNRRSTPAVSVATMSASRCGAQNTHTSVACLA